MSAASGVGILSMVETGLRLIWRDVGSGGAATEDRGGLPFLRLCREGGLRKRLDRAVPL
jgi:hypothetical protein